MGCDIHGYWEKKIGDAWVSLIPKTFNKYFEEGDPESQRMHLDPHEHGLTLWRNYSLFAMLANVRNGRGFAGCKIGEPLLPIAKPRGIPEDLCADVREEWQGWGADGHTPSWFTLAELLAVPWKTRLIEHSGMVDAWQYKLFVEKGEPESSSGSISGDAVREVTPEEMAEILGNHELTPPKDAWSHAYIYGLLYVTRVNWFTSWASATTQFQEQLAKVQTMSAAEGFEPENVRFTFWFDN